MAEGINGNLESYKFQSSHLQKYDTDGNGELSIFEMENISDEEGLEILYKEMSSPNVDEQIASLEAQLKAVEDEQGFIGSLWNGIKNITNIGSSSEKCQKAIEDFKNGEITYDEASSIISEFQSKQKNSVNLVSNIATGVAVVAVVGSAVMTGGLSLGVIGAAAGVGAATKAGLKLADRATNKVEGDALDGKQIAKDALSGAVDGAVSVATMGIGTAAVTGKTVATQTVKQTIIQGAKQGAIGGSISGAAMGASDYTIEAAFEEDVQFSVDDLAKTTLLSAAGGALAGGVMGGVNSGVQYKKVTALQNNTPQMHQTYQSHIDEATTQIKNNFDGSDSVTKITGRAKSEKSIFDKLFSKLSKGKLASTELDDCFAAIGDGYGTRIQLKSLTQGEATEIIEKGLQGTGISADDFIKYLDGQVKGFDGISDDSLKALSTTIINELKEKQTGDVVKRLIAGIEDGSITITELNNYGDEVSSYFTNSQLQDIADAYFKKTGQHLDIVTLQDFNQGSGSKITVDDIEQYSSKVKTDGATKKSGYTSTQMNTKHTFEDGTTGLGELQIRGSELNSFADAEHIPYDIRQGKITVDDTKYSSVYNLISNMSDDSYKAYNSYLKDTYNWIRLKELGIETTEPLLTGTFTTKTGEVISSESMELISRQGLLAFSH